MAETLPLLPGGYSPHPDDTARAKDLEASETPRWAAEAILRHELMPRDIVDPCYGRGVLTQVAMDAGYYVAPNDIHDWGHDNGLGVRIGDFLEMTRDDLADQGVGGGFGVFMNPPFSLIEDFISHSFALGARKVIAFKQFSFWEGQERWSHSGFWGCWKHLPNRVYVCAKRATCWRFDIPREAQKSSTTQAYAWFVFERGHPPGTQMWRITPGVDNV